MILKFWIGKFRNLSIPLFPITNNFGYNLTIMSSPSFDFGMIGLGTMGRNLLLNIADHGFSAIGFDRDLSKGALLESSATAGTTVKGAASLAEVAQALNSFGVSPRELASILQALKSAGALRAEIVVQ